MRYQFPGYYPPSKKEIQKLWEEGIFIFDTNVLLDFYRYSDETVQALIQILENLNKRIWIPYQVSKEYHKSLNSVIVSQVKKYSDSIKMLQDFKKQIDEKRNHPFFEESLQIEINEFCNKINTELNARKDKIQKLLLDNPIKEKLADLLDGKIGAPFSEEEIAQIYTEGEKRYQNRIPPGYSDGAKPVPEKFGDLIVWKEILKRNSLHEVPVIFVTGDVKEDWFITEMGMTIAPRPELIDEFRKAKNNLFYCYPANAFLNHAKEYLNAEVKDKTLEEVKDLINQNRNEAITESHSEITMHEDSGQKGEFTNLTLTGEKNTYSTSEVDNQEQSESE